MGAGTTVTRCVLIGALLLVGMSTLAASTAPGVSPRLIFDDSVGSDFRVLALETWDLFVATFGDRAACAGDVRLHASRELASRAAYDPPAATVTVHVPGSAAMLQGALIHEWAHHVEFQCPAHATLRQRFLAAVGLPPDTPWRPDDLPAATPADTWARIPSERYAEASISLVLGRNQIPTKIVVTQAEIDAIAAWIASD